MKITDLDNDLTNELTVIHGTAVKDLGNGKIGGYALLFTTADDPDVEGDFFTKDSSFDLTEDTELSLYYSHGLDPTIDNRKIGRARLKATDAGLWAEAQLNLRDEYEQAIYRMVRAGKLGYSTGSVAHLVRREAAGKSSWLKCWPIAELSLTPVPAEPRTCALPLKKLQLPSILEPGQIEELTLTDEFNITVAALDSLTNRLDSLKELRTAQKRRHPLTQANIDRLSEVKARLEDLIACGTAAVAATEQSAKERQQQIDGVTALFDDAATNLAWLSSL